MRRRSIDGSFRYELDAFFVVCVCLCHVLLCAGVVLYEYLGEEYPEVLGSILGALKAIVNVIGMNKMTPPIKDLLPRLTPILRNRHEKVQENAVDLVGRIADRGPESVSPREWMRICFELLELLKAPKKGKAGGHKRHQPPFPCNTIQSTFKHVPPMHFVGLVAHNQQAFDVRRSIRLATLPKRLARKKCWQHCSTT